MSIIPALTSTPKTPATSRSSPPKSSGDHDDPRPGELPMPGGEMVGAPPTPAIRSVPATSASRAVAATIGAHTSCGSTAGLSVVVVPPLLAGAAGSCDCSAAAAPASVIVDSSAAASAPGTLISTTATERTERTAPEARAAGGALWSWLSTVCGSYPVGSVPESGLFIIGRIPGGGCHRRCPPSRTSGRYSPWKRRTCIGWQ